MTEKALHPNVIQPPSGADAYAPSQIAAWVETAGVAKARIPTLKMFVLALLAGAFIAFGGMFYELAITDSGMGLGPTRIIGGLCFSLGLILVVVGGAELFTGNNLIVMAWAERHIATHELLRNWGLVYAGNIVGSLGMVILVHYSGSLSLGDGGVAKTAVSVALGKVALSPLENFIRGILCNTLVCLAVWLTFASRRVSGKILAILFPVTAFVALGFEHSIANMYLIPIGMLQATGAASDTLTVSAMLANIVPVTLGNIVGGGVFVAFVYWVCYLRK